MLFPENKTYVFLPGFGFKASIWQSFAKRLNQQKCIFCEPPMRLHNKSNLLSLSKTLESQLPDTSILIGWSLGGLIASALCHQFPKKILALITVCSTPKFSAEQDWIGVNPKLIARFHREAKINFPSLINKFQSLIHKDLNLQNHFYELEYQSILLFYLDLLFQSDVREFYSALNLPTLHIFGDQDDILPLSCAKQIKNHYSHHHTQIIEGAGHAPFLTHPEEFMQCLNAFINKI